MRTTKKKPQGAPRPDVLRIRWEGSFWNWHSLGLVNRECCAGLLRRPGVELAIAPTDRPEFQPDANGRYSQLSAREFTTLSGPADIHVRHYYPPQICPPVDGRFVLMQPWEYGYLPTHWVQEINEHVDEIWCYTEYVRQVYLASGIAPEILHVIPLGVDTDLFRPDAPPYVFTDEPGAARFRNMDRQPFVFLFCGGTIDRKGIDELVEAFLYAFAPAEPVALVIKDTGTKTVYRGGVASERLRALANDETRACIVYIEHEVASHQLAGLYTAADAVVQPYRAEGFCLPALEAMSAGRPVICTGGDGAPTDDFVDAEVGWRVPAARKPMGSWRVGDWICCGEPWWYRVNPRDLAKTMREVFENRAEAKARGAAGAVRARERYTWEHTVDAILARTRALHCSPACPATRRQPLQVVSGKPVEALRPQKEAQQAPFGVVDRRSVRETTATQEPALARKPAHICLCMIVRNEERVLADCLKSVQASGAVDSVVIVDTGSTDATKEIALSFAEPLNLTLHNFEWCDSFSAARNFSLDMAGAEPDWLFWMDADDTIPAESGANLREAVELAESVTMGILMHVRIPPPPGQHGETVVDHVKLIRNRRQEGDPGKAFFRFESRIHEQILDPITREGGAIERSAAWVVHSGYDYSPEGQKRKRERDIHLLTLDEQDSPLPSMAKWNLGMTFFHLGRFEEAIVKLEEALAISKPQESTVHKAYAMLGASCVGVRDLDRARNYFDRGLALFPHDTELLFRSASFYQMLGDNAAAEALYLRLLTPRAAGGVDSLDISMATYKGELNYAGCLLAMGKPAEAEAHIRRALAYNDTFVPALEALMHLCREQGRFAEAQAIQQRIATLNNNS